MGALSPLYIVPEKSSFILERFGKFCLMAQPGLGLKIPIVDVIAYKHTLK